MVIRDADLNLKKKVLKMILVDLMSFGWFREAGKSGFHAAPGVPRVGGT